MRKQLRPLVAKLYEIKSKIYDQQLINLEKEEKESRRVRKK